MSVGAIRQPNSVPGRSRFTITAKLFDGSRNQVADVPVSVVACFVVEIKTAFAEEGETDGAEFRVQIAENGFAGRALLSCFELAVTVARPIYGVGKTSVAEAENGRFLLAFRVSSTALLCRSGSNDHGCLHLQATLTSERRDFQRSAL
jgi:hypothetical protein